jgi:hypothetical protein
MPPPRRWETPWRCCGRSGRPTTTSRPRSSPATPWCASSCRRCWPTIEFEASPAGQPVLDALAALRSLEGRKKVSVDKVPAEVVSPAWRRLVGEPDGPLDRRAYTFAVLERLRSALRARDVFVTRSQRWSDPRAKLLGPRLGGDPGVRMPHARAPGTVGGGAAKAGGGAGRGLSPDGRAPRGQHRGGAGQRQGQALGARPTRRARVAGVAARTRRRARADDRPARPARRSRGMDGLLRRVQPRLGAQRPGRRPHPQRLCRAGGGGGQRRPRTPRPPRRRRPHAGRLSWVAQNYLRADT